MENFSSHKTQVGTLSQFLNKNCLNYILYLVSECAPNELPDVLYGYISRHAEVRMRNARSQGDRLVYQLLYNMIEDAPDSVWSALAAEYLELFPQVKEPESGNWICPDPLQD